MNKTKTYVPDGFNWKKYIRLNDDLKHIVKKEDAIKHYIKHGQFEKRPYKIDIPDDFDWKKYIKLNNDLNNITKKEDAINHYIDNGYFEHRIYNLQNKYYYSNNNLVPEHSVTAVIINYNNSKTLLKRLKSVYNQTVSPNEVIIIDDCSTDNSVEIIEDYINCKKDKIKIKTRVIVNSTNLGSGYYNWINGIELANTDFIWIAEADDYCELNFIEVLLPKFKDLSISISYCKSIFINKNNQSIWTIDKYLDEKWKNSFTLATSKLVKHKWGHLNIIPNVSSCIFRKPDKQHLETIQKYLNNNVKLVIDWMFYLLISKNSSISYSVDTTNYYFVYENSVSQKIQKTSQYLNEHMIMAEFIIQHFNIDMKHIKQLKNNLLKHMNILNINMNIADNELTEFKEMKNYFVPLINNIKIETVLIFSYGFLQGGGEIFPIYLANELYNKNVNVIFMIYDKHSINKSILGLLNKHIRIVNNSYNLANIINDFNITHINTHHQCCESIVCNYILNNKSDLKHYVTDHGMYNIVDKNQKYLLNMFERCKSNIVSINKDNLKNFKTLNNLNNLKNLNLEKRVIPISIQDYEFEKITRESIGLSNNDFVITLASRCMREKGWEEMIQIMNKINVNYQNVKLLLIGDYLNEFGLKLKETNFNKNIFFLGYQEKIKRFYDISDIGILPTYYKSESNPIVLIECLQVNKPFIASNLGNITNMLYGKNGYAGSIIDLDKNENIVIDTYVEEILKYMLDNDYMTSKIMEIPYAKEKFSMSNVADMYIDFFRNSQII